MEVFRLHSKDLAINSGILPKNRVPCLQHVPFTSVQAMLEHTLADVVIMLKRLSRGSCRH